uniref:UDP-glycosyltransferase n=1 Tax=Polyphagotarsonemus latus TaxID=1204166 RepID=A0AAN0LIY7_9ACAR
MGKLLFIPMLTYGHFNCAINIGRYLIDKNPKHEIYFLVSDLWEKKLMKIEPKFKSLVYITDENAWSFSKPKEKNENKENEIVNKKIEEKKDDLDSLTKIISKPDKDWSDSSLSKVKGLSKFFECLSSIYDNYKDQILKLVNDLDPNLILYDHVVYPSYLMNRPWANLMSINPLFMNHHELPPYSSGYSSKKKLAEKEWIEFRKEFLINSTDFLTKASLKLIEEGEPAMKLDSFFIVSPYFNIYIYPKEINYFNDKIKLPGKWLRLDSPLSPSQKYMSINKNDQESRLNYLNQLFSIPKDFLKEGEKLIFFSVGSMASAYEKLMTRLYQLISNVPNHKFIISKGPIDHIKELPSNCIGDKFVDQIKILQVVDLMISHGGNNSLTECFHFGVPLVILPLFSDQPDNAMRLVDLDFGYKLDPFRCTQEDFNSTIIKALNNKELTNKMEKISQRIKKDNGMIKVLNEIEKYLN